MSSTDMAVVKDWPPVILNTEKVKSKVYARKSTCNRHQRLQTEKGV